ncbi:hypothetical protein FCM35_KLT10375 [Carex littledalei]|uniref:Uncharacterized protein n=1 Tax=Carex littledalei TaxID=544730 RepID=A0A833VIR8_9POAL|nr:hypothetical protein FCM35_KLT10375 [Carex littledalei]
MIKVVLLKDVFEIYISGLESAKIGYLFCRDFDLFSLEKFDGGDTIPEGGFKHLVHIFHWSSIPNGKYVLDPSRTNNLTISNFHIPSASELQLSQTVFIKDRGGSIDVSYGDGRISGVMQLTPWKLHHISTKLYESFLIFEQNYLEVGKPFTAYVACLYCLLKTEADVKILRENGIIRNTIFDDKNVLCYVQELKTLIDDTLRMPNELVILKEKVMEHHKKSIYRVYGEFKKRYCSNTWIVISVIAGILLFVLTFIQTVYGTLSYYKQ